MENEHVNKKKKREAAGSYRPTAFNNRSTSLLNFSKLPSIAETLAVRFFLSLAPELLAGEVCQRCTMGGSSGNEQVLENVRLASDSGEGSGIEGLLSRLKAQRGARVIEGEGAKPNASCSS